MANAKKRTTTELTLADEPPRAADGMAQPEGLAALPQLLTDLTPAQMLAIAVQRGDGLDKLERLMDLQDRWEQKEARRQFVQAMAAFKADPPTIIKSKRTDFTSSRTNTRTTYSYADLSEIATKIARGLSKVGISHRWDVAFEGGKIIVSCTLTHEAGHSESVTMPPVAPDESGNKNAIQGVQSAVTYMQKYSLLTITGLAAADMDDDGRAGGGEVVTISAEQVQALEEEIRRLGADRAGFMRALRLDNLGDMRAENYEKAVEFLRSKKATGKAGTTPPRSKSASVAERYAADALAILRQKIDSTGVMEGEVLERYTAASLEGLTPDQIEDALAWLARVV